MGLNVQKFIRNNLKSPYSSDEKDMYRQVGEVPVFLSECDEYIDKRAEKNITNPYSFKSLELIQEDKEKYILDFGAGRPPHEELFENVIRMDFVHYDTCHIVSTHKNIPFKDNTFDHVISESVFEHVKNPWNYACELHRVLKPGGKIIVDTAFLQPVHGDPYHFYNMTLHGLRECFQMFTEIDSGVEEYQSPGMTMNILSRYFIDLIEDEDKKKELKKCMGEIDFSHDYDRYISRTHWPEMSAGVFFVGKKERHPTTQLGRYIVYCNQLVHKMLLFLQR